MAPGPTATAPFLDGKSAEVMERLAKMPLLERLAETTDNASVVSLLAGSDGGWVNGQTLSANGGIV